VAQFASTCCAGAVPAFAAGVSSRAWTAAHSKLPAKANNTVRATALAAEIMLAPWSMPGRRALQYDGVRKQKTRKLQAHVAKGTIVMGKGQVRRSKFAGVPGICRRHVNP
jgi:hypothetical protein